MLFLDGDARIVTTPSPLAVPGPALATENTHGSVLQPSCLYLRMCGDR